MIRNPLLKMSLLLLLPVSMMAQKANTTLFTKADTLRGSITPERAWWNLLHYDIQVRPNLVDKTLQGAVTIQFKVLTKGKRMQIDLQQPLVIDSVFFLGKTKQALKFTREGNVAMVNMPNDLKVNMEGLVQVHYQGVPRAAIRAPWDGGISWTKDELGNPFVATSCQGLGASVWWPCKDHQYDEPEKGVTISVRVPDSLMNVSNGRLINTVQHEDATKSWVWQVTEPINNYSVSMNIGKYIHMHDELNGEAGKLSLDYYVLPQNKAGAERQFSQVKPMIEAFEHWFGKYPFYKDGYKLVEAPYLGMEHQSSVTYGNGYQNGYRGTDLSISGWGLKFDFIIIHESGHEWFANSITYKDVADMWIHESFTNYSENLYVEYYFGKEAGYEYVLGCRGNIRNDRPIVGIYNVNYEGSGDMYYKGGNVLHTLRQIVDDDEKWRSILRGLNCEFYHEVVTGEQIENFLSEKTGINLQRFFDQYLRDVRIPVFEYYVKGEELTYRWNNCVRGFDMPLKIFVSGKALNINPKQMFSTIKIETANADIKV